MQAQEAQQWLLWLLGWSSARFSFRSLEIERWGRLCFVSDEKWLEKVVESAERLLGWDVALRYPVGWGEREIAY